jgi:hypothetical protein
MNNLAGALLSLIGGGLAGGCVNVLFNRMFYWRQLRIKFYPKLNDMHTAYAIRMEQPQGRYLVTIVGQMPSKENAEFVDHRADFVVDLVQFTELREARKLRRKMVDNLMRGEHTPGILTKVDLAPEAQAMNDCIRTLHKKLKL